MQLERGGEAERDTKQGAIRRYRREKVTRRGNLCGASACQATAPVYFPTTRIENESGSIGARTRPPFFGASLGASAGGAGGGPNSAAISRMWSVLLSKVSVLARVMVFRFCSTTKLVGLFSLMTLSVPSPLELTLLFANMALCGQRLPTGSPCSAHACSCGMTRLVRAPMVKFLSIAPKRHRHFWHSADVQRVHEVQLPCRSAFHCVR